MRGLHAGSEHSDQRGSSRVGQAGARQAVPRPARMHEHAPRRHPPLPHAPTPPTTHTGFALHADVTPAAPRGGTPPAARPWPAFNPSGPRRSPQAVRARCRGAAIAIIANRTEEEVTGDGSGKNFFFFSFFVAGSSFRKPGFQTETVVHIDVPPP